MIRIPKLKLKKIVQSRREASPNFSPSPMGTSGPVSVGRERRLPGGPKARTFVFWLSPREIWGGHIGLIDPRGGPLW